MKIFFKLFIIIGLMFNSFGYSQNYEKETVIWGLDTYFKEKQIGLEYKFKYTLENSLNCEIFIRADRPDNKEIDAEYMSNLKKGSKDIVLMSLVQMSDLNLYSKLVKDCDFKYALFKVTYYGDNVDYVSFYYNINIQDLADCRYNFNDLNCKNALKFIK